MLHLGGLGKGKGERREGLRIVFWREELGSCEGRWISKDMWMCTRIGIIILV